MILDGNNNYRLSFEKTGFKIFSLDEYINYGESAPDLLSEKVFTIIWSGKNKFTHTVNGVVYELPRNTFLYLSPHAKQNFIKQKSKSDGFLLLFKEEFYARSIAESLNLRNCHLFSSQSIRPIKNLISAEQIFKNVFIKNLQSIHFTELERKLQRNIIERILLNGKAVVNLEDIHLKEEDFDVKLATKFFELVKEHVHQEKMVIFYTNQLYVTKKRLDKAVMKLYHKSAKELIIDELINKSKILLIHTEKPIKDIALELNFNQETNFTAFFKKNVGTSPSLFRQKAPN